MAEMDPTVALLAEYLTKLVGPLLALLTGLFMLINTTVLHPPPDPTTVSAAGALVVIALGRGFDKVDKLRGRE